MYFCRSPGEDVSLAIAAYMTFLHETRSSFFVGALLIMIAFTGQSTCLAQAGEPGVAEVYQDIYAGTAETFKDDPLLRNGVYYSYPYYNAQGHPFLFDKDFENGSVDFRGKHYERLSINYELFNQQLILSWEVDGMLQMSLLDPQFVSGFELKDLRFIRAETEEGVQGYFQVVAAQSRISCYYGWYKDRREVRDSGNRSIFSFSEPKYRRYIYLDDRLQRYKSNKTFIRILPEEARNPVKAYLQTNSLQVMEASDEEMDRLISHCHEILEQAAEEGME